jgi:hypothetical protein
MNENYSLGISLFQFDLDVSDIEARRHTIDDSPSIETYPPPYHIAHSSHMTIDVKLEHIQNYIQHLEYNYTGMQFFNINPDRSLHSLMNTVRYMSE